MDVRKIGDDIPYLIFLGTIGGMLLASGVVLFFVRYQRRFIRQQAAIRAAELEHQRELMASVIRSQEEERIRISKDLHDHVGATLSGLRMQVSQIASPRAEADAMKRIAKETKEGIDGIIEDVRNISHSLSPAGLELWGFHEAMEAYCEKTASSSGIDIHVTDETDGALKQLIFDDSLALFRVIQELVNNTIKHANAKGITITVRKNNEDIEVLYADDGMGVDMTKTKAAGIGMFNIESRLHMLPATYAVTSSPGNGYTFVITIPGRVLHKQDNHGKD